MRHVDTALYEIGMQLQSQRMELSQSVKSFTDRTWRERSWLCEELEI